jgi:hypothetical protein
MTNVASFAVCLSCVSLPLLASCGDDSSATIDAGTDAPPKVNFQSYEGGEVRLEYLKFPPGNNPADRARATAFFYKGPKATYPLPDIPGCTKYGPNEPARWPLAQAADREYLDVGEVIISGGPTPLSIAAGNVPGSDFLDREYTGPWRFSSLNDMGRTYISDNTVYDVTLTGSSEWPEQTFEDVLFMPDYWPLVSPDETVTPVMLTENQPLTITYTPPTNSKLPAGMRVDTLIAFTNINPPSAICVEEGIDGSITIPADIINHVIASNPASRILRQHVVHQLRELTNGTVHENRRIDFLSVWCFNYPYASQ